jgi:hypothetical protein
MRGEVEWEKKDNAVVNSALQLRNASFQFRQADALRRQVQSAGRCGSDGRSSAGGAPGDGKARYQAETDRRRRVITCGEDVQARGNCGEAATILEATKGGKTVLSLVILCVPAKLAA